MALSLEEQCFTDDVESFGYLCKSLIYNALSAKPCHFVVVNQSMCTARSFWQYSKTQLQPRKLLYAAPFLRCSINLPTSSLTLVAKTGESKATPSSWLVYQLARSRLPLPKTVHCESMIVSLRCDCTGSGVAMLRECWGSG